MNKRFLTAVVASSLLAIGAIYAEDNCCNPCPQDCPPVCKPCPAPCEPCPPPPCNPCPSPCYEPCYDPCYDPCETDSCCWTGFEIGADFIYWRPCIDDLEYAAVYDRITNSNGHSAGVHNAKYHHVSTNWEPGFRVFASIDDLWCDWGLYGSYTWIKSSNSAKVNRSGTEYLESVYTHTWDVIGPVNQGADSSQEFVTMDQELTYQDFNALFITEYCLKSCHNFKPYFGVTGIFLDRDNESEWKQVLDTGTNTLTYGSTKWTSNLNTVGFRFGSEFSFAICDGLKLFGNGSGAVTVGNHDSKVTFRKSSDDQTEEIITEYDYTFKDDECIFVPGYHVQIGFEYDVCWCGCDFGLRLGYEFLNWHNLPNIRKWSSEGPPESTYASSPTVNTLGFHGLFAGLEFSF